LEKISIIYLIACLLNRAMGNKGNSRDDEKYQAIIANKVMYTLDAVAGVSGLLTKVLFLNPLNVKKSNCFF
jgi:hypothetical protein